MSKENRSSHAAKRGPMGHRGPGAPTEKAKNFWEGRQLSWSADLPLKFMEQAPSISTVSQRFCYF